MNEYIYPTRIHIEDTDFAGIVYHSNYLKFMERARSEWFEELGFGMTWQRAEHLYFPIHSINMQFLIPGRVHEKIEVVSKIIAIGRASITFSQYLRFALSPDKILCRAEVKLACVNDDLRPRALPEIPMLENIRRTLT